jgi:hypothetical protein
MLRGLSSKEGGRQHPPHTTAAVYFFWGEFGCLMQADAKGSACKRGSVPGHIHAILDGDLWHSLCAHYRTNMLWKVTTCPCARP